MGSIEVLTETASESHQGTMVMIEVLTLTRKGTLTIMRVEQRKEMMVMMKMLTMKRLRFSIVKLRYPNLQNAGVQPIVLEE
jgi:hypothetical protein